MFQLLNKILAKPPPATILNVSFQTTLQEININLPLI